MNEIDRFRNLSVFDEIASKVIYAFSPYSFGNMSFPYGDKDEVLQNRAKFLNFLNIDPKNVVYSSPVHKVNVEIVTTKHKGRGAIDKGTAIPSTDALITIEKGVALALNAADCAPIIITNKNADFVSLVHAGRDGTDAGICQVAVSRLQAMGLNNLQDFLVGIGPAIGSCYKQDFLQTRSPDVWLPFIGVSDEKDIEIQTSLIGGTEDPLYKIEGVRGSERVKLSIDLVECNISQLVNLGIPRENISASYICTACNGEEKRIFSHVVSARYVGTQKAGMYPEGRFMAVAQLT